MSNCPTCGRPIPFVRAADDLIRRMRDAHSRGADCYQGRDGNYYISHGGGEVSRGAIDEALERGLIKPKYPDTPHLYWSLDLIGSQEP